MKKVASGASMKENTRRPQMNNQQKYFTVKPIEFDLFCGMDVDKKSISITFISHDGFIKSFKIPYDSANLIAYVRRRYADKRIAFVYEAGPTGFGLYDDLVSAGYVCLVIPPTQMSRSAADRVKTNRLDSLKLAEDLRGGRFKGIHVPCRLYRDLRHLVHLREIVVRNQAATKVRIKLLLLLEGIRFPAMTTKERWSIAALSRLHLLQTESEIRFKLDQYLTTLQFSKDQLQIINNELLRFCKQDSDLWHCLNLLCTIPGIGKVVSIYLLARIGDWRYLSSSRQIANLLGMVPVEHSTGDRIRKGAISRMADATTRSKLVESSWMAIRKDPQLMEFYQRIKARNPVAFAGRKAIVAVARKLTTRIYAVLKYQRPYVVKEVSASGADPELNSTSGNSRMVRARKRIP
jgi:transposase